MSGALVRRMRWWDVGDVETLEQRLFPTDPWSAATFWSELAGVPATRHYVVAHDGDALVGYAGLSALPPDADVQTLAVHPERQGQGLGRMLLDGLLAEARARGCSQVMLEVREENAAAQHLYVSAGFERLARRSGYYGPGRDAVVMRLRLADAMVGSEA